MGHGRSPRGRPNRRQEPELGRVPVRFGEAELSRDPDRPSGWLLSVNGVAQSYVDLEDPTHLEFDYVRRIGDVVDLAHPAGEPLDVLHIGGGACTVARYVAATRRGSRQLVIEADGPLVDLVREHMDLRSVPQLKVRVGDGRQETATRRDDTADLVVVDAFESALMPGPLATREYTREVRRVLRPQGTYVANLADGGGLHFARRFVATLGEVFEHVLVMAEPGVFRGRRFGNIVAAASGAELPVAELTRRTAGSAFPARCVAGQEFARNAKALSDDEPVIPPQPPPDALGRS
ncbi:spermidine synthase [Kutzneria sp. 744]|nr:spermidine synthase [Kutzneria sp. 744]